MALRTTNTSPARMRYKSPLDFPPPFETPPHFEIPGAEIDLRHRNRLKCVYKQQGTSLNIDGFGAQTKLEVVPVQKIPQNYALSSCKESDERLSEIIARINTKLSQPVLSVMETFNASVRSALKQKCEKIDNMGDSVQNCLNPPPEGLLKDHDLVLSDKEAKELYLSILDDLKKINGKIEDLRAHEFDIKLIITNKDKVVLKKIIESRKHKSMSSRYNICERENEYSEDMAEFSPKQAERKTLAEKDKPVEDTNMLAKTYALLGIYPHLNQPGTVKAQDKTSPDKKATPKNEDDKLKPNMIPGVQKLKILKDMAFAKTQDLTNAAFAGTVQKLDKIKNNISGKLGSISPRNYTKLTKITPDATNKPQEVDKIKNNISGNVISISPKHYTKPTKITSDVTHIPHEIMQKTPTGTKICTEALNLDGPKDIPQAVKFDNPFLYHWPW